MNDNQPQLSIPPEAAWGPTFDVGRATDAYIATIPAADRAKSDAYYEGGYWIGAIASTFIPWNLATLAGVYAGGSIADPSLLGIDIIFPAAMIGLAAGLVTGRRELVAAFAGAAIAVSWALLVSPALAIEPFAAFLVRFRSHLAHVERVMGGLLVLTGIGFLAGFFTQLNSWLIETFPVLQNIG